MEILPALVKELEQEAVTTRKFLKIFPADNADWKPHEKSMTMMALANHVSELSGWPALGLATDGIDFAKGDYVPQTRSNAEDLLALYEDGFNRSIAALKGATEDDLKPDWSLKNGEHVIASWNKYEMIRHSLAQQTHHRAQLGLYYRLNNIAIPGSYGPSADDENF